MKLIAMQKDKHRRLKAALYGLLLGGGLMGGTLVVLAADAPQINSKVEKRVNQDVVPLVRVNPQYPQNKPGTH